MAIKLPESHGLSHSIEWWDYDVDSVDPADSAHQLGRSLDYSNGQVPHCVFIVPWPAARCGHYVIKCYRCGGAYAVQTNGRLDDPVSVKVGCFRYDQEGGRR
jgi:hypothetical protein